MARGQGNRARGGGRQGRGGGRGERGPPQNNIEEQEVDNENDDVPPGGRGPNRLPEQLESDDENKAPEHIDIGYGSFVNGRLTRVILPIIRAFLSGSWRSWKFVPVDVKRHWWLTWLSCFSTPPSQLCEVERVWKRTATRSYNEMMARSRKSAKKKAGDVQDMVDCIEYKPDWMGDIGWNELCKNAWTGAEWEKISNQAQSNRNSEKNGDTCKSACGSIPLAAHERRLESGLGRRPTGLELVDDTHKKDKGKGDFVDSNSRITSEKMHEKMNAKYGENQATHPYMDSAIWLDVLCVGPPLKGRLYGYGDREHAHVILGISSASTLTSQANAQVTPFSLSFDIS